MSDGSSAKSACHDTAQQLALCMQSTPCVRDEGLPITDCLKRKDGTADCEALRTAYYQCRRSQLDMRSRIRGKRFQDTG